jgi:hypothetical protein
MQTQRGSSSRDTRPIPTHVAWSLETARKEVLRYIQDCRWSNEDVRRFMASGGVTMTAGGVSMMLSGKRGVGPTFIRLFHMLFNIELNIGLIAEAEKASSPSGIQEYKE